MKKITNSMLVSFVFLATIAVVAYLADLAHLDEFWWAFVIATALIVVGILLLFIKKPQIKPLVIAINAISMGFYLRSWYINRGLDNSLLLMLGVVALAVLYMVVFVLPLLIPFVNRHYGWYLLIFVILSLGGYVCLLAFTKTTWVSTLGYFGIIQLAFIMGLSFDTTDNDEQISSYLISSYSVLVCGVVILLLVLSADDCECDLSCDGCGSSKEFSSPIRNKKDDKI